jgi:hypothetical protein
VNLAVQAAFSRASDFDAGTASEFSGVSPIVGTVNLKGATSADGVPLVNDVILTNDDDVSKRVEIPQRSNMLLTAGFSLPGFEGRLRAFRTYRPEEDDTPSGYRFTADGTRLWPDLDGRPELAGLARTPADPAQRNIYTYVPDGSGGGSVVAFTAANAALLQPHMGIAGDGLAAAIETLRAQPLGAVIGSTPALMDPPSLDPPPDEAYGRADTSGSFASTYQHRRSIIFFGANDGMIHAVDARTGFEVWAFIPYNLLPKLRTLLDGQPVQQFDYFVDSSPKIAEVKINTAAGHAWRSLLIIGQAQGGTFYQAFDVTEAGMGRRAGPGFLDRGRNPAPAVRHAGRKHPLHVGVPQLQQLRPDLLRATSGGRRDAWLEGDVLRRSQTGIDGRREERRVHVVGSGRGTAQSRTDHQRRDDRIGVFPGG